MKARFHILSKFDVITDYADTFIIGLFKVFFLTGNLERQSKRRHNQGKAENSKSDIVRYRVIKWIGRVTLVKAFFDFLHGAKVQYRESGIGNQSIIFSTKRLVNPLISKRL